MDYEDLTESDWAKIKSVLPCERGRQGRPAIDNRQIVNGILWRFHTNAPWRDLPQKYGKWITVYQRFRRWNRDGVWGQLQDTYTSFVKGNDSYKEGNVGDLSNHVNGGYHG